MKPHALHLLLALPLAACHSNAPAPLERMGPEPTEQHRWLMQLVGDWEAEVPISAEMQVPAEDGSVSTSARAEEHVRAHGDYFVVSDGTYDFGASRMASVMTLGFDPRREVFVGTWIDTAQPHMWVYEGGLDEAGKVLSLEAFGPSFEDPAVNALYRDAIELVDADHKILTSSLRGPDGSWIEFMRTEFVRVR
ncbi:MAG: DUF1579 domain-containing protein [Planctomycetota bacterium]